MDLIQDVESVLSVIFGGPHTVVVKTHTVPPMIAPAPMPTAEAELIPQDALTFVETEEDGSAAYYAKYYTHWSWPKGASGPTIAVGYDCGYVTAAEARADWTGIIDEATVEKICAAVGKRGSEAAAYVIEHRGEITVTWDQAVQEFKEREVPKWVKRIEESLPNFDKLPGECKGAIFSLCYNRGTGGFHDPIPRDSEMRAIYLRMASPDFAVTKAWLAPIADDIESMQRLWPKDGDLWNRREHEAALYRKGLESLQ